MPDRRGKSANAVLADSVRIAAVDTCKSTYSAPFPNTSRPMMESRVWSGLSVGRRWDASTAIPRKSAPRITATQVKVIAALRDSGFRNAWMPFEIASTPLNATAPDEKARSSKKDEAPVSTAFAPVKCSNAL